MLHFARWKSTAIALSVLLSLFLCLPNILPAAGQKFMKDTFRVTPMTLGLDLQGGSNIVLELDRKNLLKQLGLQLTGDIRGALREASIGYQGITKTETGATVRISKPEDGPRAKEVLAKLLQPLDAGLFATGAPINLYDLTEDQQQFSFTVSETGLKAKTAAIITQTIKIVETRINSTGTTEPIIQQQGTERIALQLPGVQDPESVKKILVLTAKLTFQLLCEAQPTGTAQTPPQECLALPLKDEPTRNIWVQTSSRATVDGADLNEAQPGFDQNNQPVVTFGFNQKGAVRFGKLTAENVGKPFAIILDNVVVSYPVINQPILGGSGQISGNFTSEETASLSVVLKSGALPATLNIVEERTVGPSLGSDSIRGGFIAAIIGLIGVMLFMFLPYGFFGLLANLALLANLLLLIAIMSFGGFTLTLPGIAGIVLTLGMAVDSNVLIYERIREEWRNGRTAINAIETGFKAAFTTVFDANVTTLIAAVVLFGVGSGPIRGFAVTLGIGIFTTMFTAFTITLLLVSIWVKYRKPKELNL